MQLFLNSFGTYLHKDGEMFSIKINDEKKKISPKRVTSVIISNAATISTDAVQLAMEYNIDIVFLDSQGNPYGRVWFPRIGSTTLIRRRQLEIVSQPIATDYVKKWIIAKMENQISFINTLLSKRPDKKEHYDNKTVTMVEYRNKILALQGNIEDISGSLRGYEGNSSRVYYRILSAILPEKYKFNGRSSRPAEDIFNALLNYSYGVLYSKVERALVIAGLDPYIGIFHTDNYNKKSLVFDFIEPYRYLGDETAFYLCSRHKVNDNHYKCIKQGIELNEKGKKLLLPELLDRFDKIIRHRNSNMKQIDTILADAHRFANILIGRE